MSAVKMLQTHLTRVKLEHAEREAAMLERYKALQAECDALRHDYDIAREELSLCWAYVDQLKRGSTLKALYEERDDWKALVASIQEDRQRLIRENRRLRHEEDDDDHEPPTPPPPRERQPAPAERQRRSLFAPWRKRSRSNFVAGASLVV